MEDRESFHRVSLRDSAAEIKSTPDEISGLINLMLEDGERERESWFAGPEVGPSGWPRIPVSR